jgi:acetyltransferase-like isoleucine patch superfamily enzyme
VRSLLVYCYSKMRHIINSSKVSNLGAKTILSCRIERRRKGGVIQVGKDCVISGLLITEREKSLISIGGNVFVGGNTIIDCVEQIKIEDDVLISYGCLLADSDNHSIHYGSRKNDLADWRNGGGHDWSTTITRPIHIGKGAWLGARVMILKGVTVGEGAVVGAGSVVSKDVPPFTIVAGNPARVVRELDPDER